MYPFEKEIAEAVRGTLVPAPLVAAVVKVESAFNPKAYLEEPGGDGSIGLMQIRLSTAKRLGYAGSRDNLFIPAVNLYYGVRLLSDLYGRLRDWDAVISAYNGGIRPELGFGARVKKTTTVCLRRDPKTGRCIRTYTAKPGEFGNQEYVDKVKAAWDFFSRRALGEAGVSPAMLLLLIGPLMMFLSRGRV
jgi:hypothetical protein